MKMNIIAVLITVFSLSAFAGSSNTNTSLADKISKNNLTPGITTATTDSVNVKQLVLAQIDAARKKQVQDSIAAAEAKSAQVVPPVAIVAEKAKVVLKKNIEKTQWEKLYAYAAPVMQYIQMSNEMAIRITVMVSVSFFAFAIVFIRRKKLSVKNSKKKDYKDGIKLIREERVKDKRDSKLSLIRNKLIGSASSFQLSNDTITKNARELNIAKGEIYLAARIKSHELKKASY
ncbi:MAG: hypothetical protein P4L45_10940 [Ignavibacteriaceae bacterium]|nr:hypothetical protein [Ignavibacteriaceae bacterium]